MNTTSPEVRHPKLVAYNASETLGVSCRFDSVPISPTVPFRSWPCHFGSPWQTGMSSWWADTKSVASNRGDVSGEVEVMVSWYFLRLISGQFAVGGFANTMFIHVSLIVVFYLYTHPGSQWISCHGLEVCHGSLASSFWLWTEPK